ncbi:MAG: hypothetical protein V3V49_07205 [Candidatus Krumholzibacteria bacterium]
MRIAKVFLVTLVALTVVGASLASAQTPYIGVFFEVTPDFNGKGETAIPPGAGGEIDSVFFVAYNLNCLVTGFQFAVDYGPCLTLIADLDVPALPVAGPGVTFGTTATGISIVYSAGNVRFGVLPNFKDGTKNVHIATSIVQWSTTGACRNCSVTDRPVIVKENIFFGNPTPVYLCFATGVNVFHPAEGLTALICATVPVEESTWGKVKALYTR